MDQKKCRYYNEPEINSEGYYTTGFHRFTGEDRKGYNREGFNVSGVNRNGDKVMDYVRGRIQAGQFHRINETLAEEE